MIRHHRKTIIWLSLFALLLAGCQHKARRPTIGCPSPVPQPIMQQPIGVAPGGAAPGGAAPVPFPATVQPMPPAGAMPPNGVAPPAIQQPAPIQQGAYYSQPPGNGRYSPQPIAPQAGFYSPQPMPQQAWKSPINGGVQLGVPEATRPDPARPDPLFDSREPPLTQQPAPQPIPSRPPPMEQPVERPPASPLPVGIPRFAVAKQGVTAGLRPMLDGGLDWLQEHNYKAVLHIVPPGEDDSADRRQVEKRGMKYLRLEVSPQTLGPQVVEEFNRLVSDQTNYPLFVYDKDGSLAGGMWYLHFRTGEFLSDSEARAQARALGLQENGDADHREMWLAIQNYLSRLDD